MIQNNIVKKRNERRTKGCFWLPHTPKASLSSSLLSLNRRFVSLEESE